MQWHKPTHCRHCGKELDDLRRWYCGEPCRKAYWSLNVWEIAVDLALSRAGSKCEDCGSTEDLEVHHLVPLNGGPRRGDLNSQDNLRVLCHKCHRGRYHTKHMGAIPKLKEQLALFPL